MDFLAPPPGRQLSANHRPALAEPTNHRSGQGSDAHTYSAGHLVKFSGQISSWEEILIDSDSFLNKLLLKLPPSAHTASVPIEDDLERLEMKEIL